jgi:hypothetical protein
MKRAFVHFWTYCPKARSASHLDVFFKSAGCRTAVHPHAQVASRSQERFRIGQPQRRALVMF